MKNLFLIASFLVSLTFGSSSWADGFICYSPQEPLKVAIYDQVNPRRSTPEAGALIVSNPKLEKGLQTIAEFFAWTQDLVNDGFYYVGSVQHPDPNKTLGSTPLVEITEIHVQIFSSFHEPLTHGDSVQGVLQTYSEDQLINEFLLECQRHLSIKNKTLYKK